MFLLSTEDGPQPFESVCYRPCENPPQPRTCDLGEWNVEWFIGGDSPFCENCLFEYDNLRDIYLSDPIIRSCPDCIPLDGITRAVAVINRKLPGPAVHVSNSYRVHSWEFVRLPRGSLSRQLREQCNHLCKKPKPPRCSR